MEEHPEKKVSIAYSTTSDQHLQPVHFYLGSRRASEVIPGQTQLLVELYDLQTDANSAETVWIQMARWIKYEEDVEGVDQHWSRPRVPFLPYHALQQLISYIREGVVLLDVDAFNFGDIACAVTEALCERYDTSETQASAFLATLHKNFRRPADTGKKLSVASSSRKFTHLGEIDELSDHLSVPEEGKKLSTAIKKLSSKVSRASVQIQLTPIGEASEGSGESSFGRYLSVEPRPGGAPMSIKKKISRQLSHLVPGRIDSLVGENSEAAQVFAGILPEVNGPRFGMVRLKNAILMPECQETVPMRFMFMIVGPPVADVHYYDLGRAIATLMANPSFREVAYSAENRETLIRGLHEFLDCSVVIPPGKIQTKDLVNVDDVRKALRQRKTQKEEAKRQLRNAPRSHTPSFSDGLISSKHSNLETPIVIDSEGIVEKVKAAKKVDPAPVERLPWERTKKPFGGMIQDFKLRLPMYWSDYKDALNVQCISAIIFMFFVVFSPAISFGQVMNQRLDGYMGITEVFIAQCACGLIWGLFSGQPLLIQAATGPFLVFESALYQFCQKNCLEFLTVRVWVSIWVFLLSILMVLVEASFLIGYVTRFTQDIFTTLIAGIFVYEAGKFVVTTFIKHPLVSSILYCPAPGMAILINGTVEDDTLNMTMNATVTSIAPTATLLKPNTALLSMMFVILTFYLAFTLKKIRTSHYFGRTIRKALGDFGVPVTILLMVLLYQYVFSETFLQMADMPGTFGLTAPEKREWFIHPLGTSSVIPGWIIPAAIIPAILVSILLFAEIEIVELLLFNKERGLKKPMGFHWDLVLCGGLMFVSSLFGLPWMCGGAVQSLTHATSLTIMKRTAPGEKPAVDYVVEQRVTTIVVSIMIGACSFLGKVLGTIPIAVLLGIFLYLGVSCLMSIQFIHRVILLLIPRKYFPDQPYCKELSMWRMHAFTLIQLFGFALLWTVNIIPESSLAFPFVIAFDAAARRYLIPRIFTSNELQAIDPSETEKPAQNEEEDIYDETAMPM